MAVWLLVSLAAFTIFAVALFVQRYQVEMLSDEARRLRERVQELEA